MIVSEVASGLVRYIRCRGDCIVAFSGGVDSAVVATAAYQALGDRASAVTARSASLSGEQLSVAQGVAAEVGFRHEVIDTDEIDHPQYVKNDSRRCYWCKETLYRVLQEMARREEKRVIYSGTNADDLSDFRPGIDAGNTAGVISPLADLGIGKAQVRAIARLWDLSVAEAPASPCLASRLAYGVSVTPERLAKVEQAERWLREQGFGELRVRYHHSDLARIEVCRSEIPRLLEPEIWGNTVATFQQLGFRYVTIDMEGFRSGSLNPTKISLKVLAR